MSGEGAVELGKPFLIIVTGQPGAGKTTFADALGAAACLPVISRDRLKEGYVHTLRDGVMPDDADLMATDAFFDTLQTLADRGISVIAEAAFQHRLWSARLAPLYEKADVKLCICLPGSDEVARERYIRRGLKDGRRERFHGDPGVAVARSGKTPVFAEYEPPRLDVPTYHIDTTGEYVPPMDEMIRLLLDGSE